MAVTDHPINRVVWKHRDELTPNCYNPNYQPPPEHKLLKVSILQDGWTQPIVACDGIIVDGEHRWKASEDPDIYAMTDGMVPVVELDKSESERILSTVRHNRARGEHAIGEMSSIVVQLLETMTVEELVLLLGMEDEEVYRLAEAGGMPVIVGKQKTTFSNGWIPK